MDLIKKYVTKNKGAYFLSVIFAILGVIFGLMTYILLAKIIVELIVGNSNLNFFGKYCVYILGCLVFKEIFAGVSTSISHRSTFHSLKEIRKDISEKLFKMPLGDIINMSSGKLKNIIMDQVDSMETTLAHIIPEMTANLVGPILLLIYMFILDWRLGILSLIPMIIGMLIMKSVMKSYGEGYGELVHINQEMNNAVVEYINGIEVIKTFNQSDKPYKKYSDAVYDNVSFYYNWMGETMSRMSAFRAISPMSLLTILPFGIYFYIKGSIDIASLITIIVLSFGTVENILKVGNFVDDLARIGTITNEIGLILNSKDLIHEENDIMFSNYDIEFKGVDFSYEEGKKVLENIDLQVKENMRRD